MVSIDIEAPDTYRSLFNNLDFSAPRLVRFSCTVSPELLGPVHRNPPPNRMFQSHMPLLRVLRLKGFQYAEVAKFSNLINIQLITNPAVYLRRIALFEFLRCSPLMERLEIEGYWIRDEENTTLRLRIALSRLRKLRLEYASSRFILSWLDTPTITHFSVMNTSYHGKPIHPSLPDDPSQLIITRRLKTLDFTAARCLICEDFAINCHNDRGSTCTGSNIIMFP